MFKVGTDIVSIERIGKLIQKYGLDAVANRLLGKLEREKIKDLPVLKRNCYIAKRFAAKEAISKAFGTGIGKYIQFTNIDIINNENGKPIVIFHEKNSIKENCRIEISISDEYPFAIAFVIIMLENAKKE